MAKKSMKVKQARPQKYQTREYNLSLIHILEENIL